MLHISVVLAFLFVVVMSLVFGWRGWFFLVKHIFVFSIKYVVLYFVMMSSIKFLAFVLWGFDKEAWHGAKFVWMVAPPIKWIVFLLFVLVANPFYKSAVARLRGLIKNPAN